MGFMSGFLGGASTTFAEESRRLQQMALEERSLDTQEVLGIYDRLQSNWSAMGTVERFEVHNSFMALTKEFPNTPAIAALGSGLENRIKDSMSPENALETIKAALNTEQPWDVNKPTGVVGAPFLEHAFKVLIDSEYPNALEIVEYARNYVATGEANRESAVELALSRVEAEVNLTQAQIGNLEASTISMLQQFDINDEQRAVVLQELTSLASLRETQAMAAAVSLGFLAERERVEIDNILFRNTEIQNNALLFEATFDAMVEEASASAQITSSQARVLIATEALDIAIKQGQVDQIPLLLEKLRLENDNISERTRDILLNNQITEASQAALISFNHSQARLAASEANMAVVREGQYSQELAANLARTIASVRLTESQTVGQNEANRLAQAVFDDEVARVAAESRISQSSARVAVATEVSRVQAADLANTLTRGNITAQDLANAFADRTLEDRVRGVAANRNISESEARVAIATEDDTIEAAGLALESTRAQIALTNASTELTNEQKTNIGRAFLSSLITSGQPELVDLFGKDVLEPVFGEAWESALESVKEAAGVTANRTEQAFLVDVALRTAQTRAADSSADLNEFEFAARNSNPLMPEAEVIEFVTKTLGQPPLRDIVSNIDDLTSLQFATLNAKTLKSQLLEGKIDPSSLGALAPILKGFGIEIDELGEVPIEALEFAIATMETEQLAQEDAISRQLGIYASNLYRNGHTVTMDIMGLDPTNPRHVELWDRASSTFPTNYLPELQFPEAFEDLSAEDSLKVLEAAALLGTRFAGSYGVYAESTAEAIISPGVMRYVVDALKEDYDRINGEGAWERLDIPDAPALIFETLIEPEFDAYFKLKKSINRDLIRSIGIEYDPTDPSSWENTISEMDSVVSYLSAGGQSFLDRVREAGVGRYSLFGWGGPAVAEAKSYLVEDFIRNVLSGNEDLVEQLGIAERSEATAFNWSFQPKWVNVDTDALYSLASNILAEFGETSNSIYTLMTRYH